jgi:hypothetical protein
MALPLFRTQPLIAPQQPTLPAPPNVYDPRYQEQFSNTLRLYFNQLQNFDQLFTTNTGGGLLQFPYGAFSSYVDQTTTANTATKLLMEQTDFSNGVTAPSSRITTAIPGVYNLQFSVQAQNLQNSPQDMFIWLKQNGTDIVGSTGLIGLPARKDATDPAHDIKGWNFFLSMNANDYVELYWSVEDALVTIQFYPASGTPTKPSTASVVATMQFVSALPT